MQVRSGAMFLAVDLVIFRLIPSHIRPLGRTQCSCLFPHISAFLSFLSPSLEENQLVAWERSMNFSPVFPVWKEKKKRRKGGRKSGVYSEIAFKRGGHNTWYRLWLCAWISQSEVKMCKTIYCFPFPPCFKMTSCSVQDGEVLSRSLQPQSSACGKATFLPTLSFALSSHMMSFYNPPWKQ